MYVGGPVSANAVTVLAQFIDPERAALLIDEDVGFAPAEAADSEDLSEAVLRRPLSVRIREYAHIAGLLMLLAIMVLAFKNDIERQWPQIVDDLRAE